MSEFMLLPPPPPQPKSPPIAEIEFEDNDDDSIGSIPLPYGPQLPPMSVDLNGCFNTEFFTPKSHRNRHFIINKEQFKKEEDNDQDYRKQESIQPEQNGSYSIEKYEDQKNIVSSEQLISNDCIKTVFSTPESTSRYQNSIDEKSRCPDMYYPNRHCSFSMEKRKYHGNRNTQLDLNLDMRIRSFPRRQFPNNNRERDQQYQNIHVSHQSPPHFFQRRSWHGNNSYNNKNYHQEPTYSSDRYKHGWLFVDQDKYQKEYYEKLFIESEKFNNDRIAPIIFMFDLAPMVPFFTNRFCFSNHFMCERLKIDDMHFCCTEQYYMFYKARVFGDRGAMSKIMSTKDPKMMKRIGTTVYGFEQSKWNQISILVMVIASIKKYEQNPVLRRQLFETCGAELVETNPMDNRWGIGISMADWRIRDKEEWRGQNWLGRLLTMLREKLLERKEFVNEREEMLREIRETMESANSVGCLKVEIGHCEPSKTKQIADENGNDAMDNFTI